MTSSAKGTLAPASILAESWSIAAEGYDEIFVPRFKPWTDNALALLGSTEFKLPAGDVLVPTCGPGHELPLVAELLKNRNVRGTDLAPGMIEVVGTFDFAADQDGDLGFKAGDVILTDAAAFAAAGETGGWVSGELNGKQGSFPSNYCAPK